jgi:Ca2+-binding RTX toxin-like protein
VEAVETLLNIERLGGTEFDDELIGDAGNNILEGNAGNDTLFGGAGNDELDGGAGVDFLDGGEGVDTADFRNEGFGITADLNAETTTYTDDQGNIIVEVLRDIERIRATNFDDQLIGNEESNIFWGFDGNDTLIGGAGGDLLIGGAGNDTLVGGAGNDGLNGGAGADTFAFFSANQGTDTIADFNSTQGDIIQISATGFSAGLTPGVLDSDQFIIGTAAVDGGDRIIYNDVTGALFFDPDGTGALGQVQFAQLSANPVLTSNDIVVV